MFRRSRHDDLADLGTAGEEDVVEGQIQQGLRNPGVAFADGDEVSGKVSSTMSLIRADVVGVSSEGLMMAVFPAARADTRGPKLRLTG